MEMTTIQPPYGEASSLLADVTRAHIFDTSEGAFTHCCKRDTVPAVSLGHIGARLPTPLYPPSRGGLQPRLRLEWDKHRATITQLYLVDEYRLEDVKRIMSLQYAFEARYVLLPLIAQTPCLPMLASPGTRRN